jgi:hypothetical protein
MSSGKLKPIQLKPGIQKDTTEFGAEGAWVSCDKIRFRNGRPEKIGGWQAETLTGVSIEGVSRDINVWNNLDEQTHIALGTNEKLHVIQDNVVYDMTPITTIVTVADAFYTSSGSATIKVSAAAHNAAVGDHVVFTSIASSVGGIDTSVLEADYTITSVSGTDVFYFDTSVTATATSAGGGGSISINYLLATGEEINKAVFGYGAGTYGDGTYGTETSTPVIRDMRQWSIDNWGEDLVACPRGGRIYHWDVDDGLDARASLVDAAPSVNNIILTAQPKRHLVSYGTTDESSGTYDPLLVRWSDSEDFRDWTATVSNESGEFRLGSGNFIVGAVQSRREILIFTDDSVYSQKFIGNPLVFGFDKLGSNVGLIGQHAAVDINGVVYWMGLNSFFKYDGTIRVLPTTLDKFIFDSDGAGFYNTEQKEAVFAGANTEFYEAIWLYPSNGSDTIDRYVIHNYLENLWYYGTIDRTVWADAGLLDKPRAIDEAANTLYVHEQGVDDDASALSTYLESSWIDVDEGDEMAFVDRLIPDFRQSGPLTVTLKARRYPNASGDEVTKGPYTIAGTTEKVDFRIRGRQVKFIYESNDVGADFEVGKPRLRIKTDGGR